MKTLTIRLPDPLAAEIETEARTRKISKSDVVRERLRLMRGPAQRAKAPLHTIADLIGSDERVSRRLHRMFHGACASNASGSKGLVL